MIFFINTDTITVGNFQIRINGVATADITYSSTFATLMASISAAVSAKFSGVFTITGNNPSIRLATSTNEFYRVEIVPSTLGRPIRYNLALEGTIPTGTFNLSVDGVLSANITIASTLSNATITTALNGITGVPSSEFTVNGNVANGFRIRGSTARRWNIGISFNNTNTFSITGVYTDRGLIPTDITPGDVYVNVVQQGSKLIRLTADLMSMKFGQKVKTTETAGIGELEDFPSVVGSSGTFSLTMYGTVVGDWLIPMSSEGLSGVIYWYPQGKIVGNTYSSFRALLDGFDEDLPFHEKIEVSISGTRQGKLLAPRGTLITP